MKRSKGRYAATAGESETNSANTKSSDVTELCTGDLPFSSGSSSGIRPSLPPRLTGPPVVAGAQSVQHKVTFAHSLMAEFNKMFVVRK